MDRKLDLLFLLYFVSHIPIALIFDSQAIFPKWIYPQQVVEIFNYYVTEYRDCLMADPPAWFQSFIFCEMFLQFPFFFVASYAYWKGISNHQWIRLPIIVYSAHVITTLVCILHHMIFGDFSGSSYPAPRSAKERLDLCLFYLPYFIVPIILLCDALFNPIYTQKKISSNQNRLKKKL